MPNGVQAALSSCHPRAPKLPKITAEGWPSTAIETTTRHSRLFAATFTSHSNVIVSLPMSRARYPTWKSGTSTAIRTDYTSLKLDFQTNWQIVERVFERFKRPHTLLHITGSITSFRFAAWLPGATVQWFWGCTSLCHLLLGDIGLRAQAWEADGPVLLYCGSLI